MLLYSLVLIVLGLSLMLWASRDMYRGYFAIIGFMWIVLGLVGAFFAIF